MGSETTIPCSEETRDKLAVMKSHGETWEGLLTRLAEGESPDGDVERRLDAINDRLDQLPERVGDDIEGRML